MQITFTHKKINEVDLAKIPGFYLKAGRYMVSATQRKINGGIAPANAPLTVAVKKGSRTLRDRGQLMSSIADSRIPCGVAVGTNHIGARINQLGGTIRAKKTWLFIPAAYNTRKLQRRYGFKVGACMKGMRAAGYKIWFQVNKKTGVVMAKNGKRGKPFVLFILKKQVIIPARPFLNIDKTDESVLLLMLRKEIGVSQK